MLPVRVVCALVVLSVAGLPLVPPMHLHEEAREAGWTDEQLLEAIAVLSMESFTAIVNIAGDVPVDGSREETRVLRAA